MWLVLFFCTTPYLLRHDYDILVSAIKSAKMTTGKYGYNVTTCSHK